MVNVLFGTLAPPSAGPSTWLPNRTNTRIAAIVAQLMIRWLLAIRTAFSCTVHALPLTLGYASALRPKQMRYCYFDHVGWIGIFLLQIGNR